MTVVFKDNDEKSVKFDSFPDKEQVGICADLQKIEHRDLAIKFSLRLLTITLFCTFAIYFLQGFRLWGFSLPDPLLKGLACATVGQLACFVMVIFKFLFR